MNNSSELNEIIIGKAIEVHKELGAGLLESAYQECLYYEYELVNEGLRVEKEKALPIIYKELKLDHGYKINLIEKKVILKLKTVEFLNDVHTAQI